MSYRFNQRCTAGCRRLWAFFHKTGSFPKPFFFRLLCFWAKAAAMGLVSLFARHGAPESYWSSLTRRLCSGPLGSLFQSFWCRRSLAASAEACFVNFQKFNDRLHTIKIQNRGGTIIHPYSPALPACFIFKRENDENVCRVVAVGHFFELY